MDPQSDEFESNLVGKRKLAELNEGEEEEDDEFLLGDPTDDLLVVDQLQKKIKPSTEDQELNDEEVDEDNEDDLLVEDEAQLVEDQEEPEEEQQLEQVEQEEQQELEEEEEEEDPYRSKEIVDSKEGASRSSEVNQKEARAAAAKRNRQNSDEGEEQEEMLFDVIEDRVGEQIVFVNLEANRNETVPEEVEDIMLFAEKKPKDQANEHGENGAEASLKPQDEQQIAPWASSRTLRIKNPLLRLHNEIIELSDYLSPTKAEHQIREQSLDRLKKLLLEAVPGCEVKIFGSFSTELYLPNSDIDLVIVKEDEANKTMYKKVADKIMSCEKLFENINLVTNAKVPIIKFVERETQINFDISFNKEDGVKQLSEVQKGLLIYPEMRYLLMVMKCALRQRDLHETYSGGIGSFLLFCMILAFLRDLRRQYESEGRIAEIQGISLGEYLLKLFKFYGHFDVDSKKIIMHEGGAIVDKDVRDKRFSLLSPQDPTHDIGNSSFKIKECVFPLFKNRFQFFTNYNFKQGESVLKYLVNPSSQTFTFQKDIEK